MALTGGGGALLLSGGGLVLPVRRIAGVLCRDFDGDVEAAFVSGAGGDGPAVCGDDGFDDGQAQAEAAFGGRRSCVFVAAERLEQCVGLVGRDGGAGVGDLKDRAGALGPGGDAYPAGGDVVPLGVLDEVADELFEEYGIAHDRCVVEIGPYAHGAVVIEDLGGGEHMGHDVLEVDRRRLFELVLAVGQQQQALDELGVPFVDVQERSAEVDGLRCRRRFGGLQFDQRAFQGQGSAQLVGGAGDEPALTVEGLLKSVEHGIETVSEPFGVVVAAGQRDAFEQVALCRAGAGDAFGSGGDGVQRVKGSSGDEASGPGGDDADGEDGDPPLGEQGVERGVLDRFLFGVGLPGELLDADRGAVGHGDGGRAGGSGLLASQCGHAGVWLVVELVVEAVLDDDVQDGEQGDAGEEEQSAVEDGQAVAQAPALHRIRYPAPGTVSMRGGSPSLRRSRIMVTRTVLLNGSMFSSHAFSSSRCTETTPPPARSSSVRTANSLMARSIGRPSRVTWCWWLSRRRPLRSRIGPSGGAVRRVSAWTRAASSTRAKGLVR